MEPVSPACVPTCGELGHEQVSIFMSICRHHGAAYAHLMAYRELGDGPEPLHESEWLAGPFTLDLDMIELEVRVQNLLRTCVSLAAET